MSNELMMPGYRICEYRLIVPLSETLQEAVAQIRRQLHEEYRVSLPFELAASLTVLHYHAYEGTEQKLMERMQQAIARVGSFEVELQNFGSESSHTIYINVPTHLPFQELARELKAVKSLITIPDHDPHFISNSHLLIAQNLKPFQFIRMWMDCEHRPFTGRFTAGSVLLMKRSVTHTRYEELRRFELASLTNSIKQGSLFG